MEKSFSVNDSDFIKSEASWGYVQNCVSVAIKPEGVAVRDTKDHGKATQFYTHNEWKAFTEGVKSGQFDIK